MEEHRSPAARCLQVVAALDVQLGWRLSVEAQHAYVDALLRYLPPDCADTYLHRLAQNYHADHQLVQALQDREHTLHDQVWTSWMGQAIRILRHASLESMILHRSRAPSLPTRYLAFASLAAFRPGRAR
jgi:hypothetical protein